MKVERVCTRVLNTLDDTPLLSGLPDPHEHVGPRELVFIDVTTDEGLRGLGLTYWHGALSRALAVAVDALGHKLLGLDPTRVEGVRRRLRDAVGRTSADGNGLFHLALAAIDLACWDIKAQAAGVPLWALIGGFRDRIDAYASGALLRGYATETLASSAARLVELGFRQVKLQCGSETSTHECVDRVRAVREAIGPDTALMCDINQLWTVPQAIATSRRLERFDVFWLEDPIPPDRIDDLRRITASTSTPIVAGEYLYGIRSFSTLVDARAADIVMIDVLRVGGVTPWLKVAGIAEAAGLPVVSHRLPEIDVHLVAAVPNGLTVEYRPLTSGLFDAVPTLEAGRLVAPQRPGLGLALTPDAIERYQVWESVA
jgi:L-alanine-DL-glutamate epimerase-like enolase superfamily enzyme